MIKNIKVSILIPLYNSEVYIAETLESCLNQTYENIEIIIVDDGSTDNSLTIVQTYEDKYKHIKVVSQKNLGASAARNKAFSLASGDYIQYLDADDILDIHKITLQVEVLKELESDVVVFGTWGTFQKSIENVIWKYPPVNKNYHDSKQFLIDLWNSGMTVVVHSWLVPRQLIERSAGWNEEISTNDDGEFFARIVFAASEIVFVQKSKVFYRKDNENSLSMQLTKKAVKSNLQSFETYQKLFFTNQYEYLYDIKTTMLLVYSRYMKIIPIDYGDMISIATKNLQILGFNKPLNMMKFHEKILIYILGYKNVFMLKKYLKKIIK